MDQNRVPGGQKKRSRSMRWVLLFYDILIYALTAFFAFLLYPDIADVTTALWVSLLGGALMVVFRICALTYKQIWRYGGAISYLRLLIADGVGGVVFTLLVLWKVGAVCVPLTIAIVAVSDMFSMGIRLVYRYAYQIGSRDTKMANFLRGVIRVFTGTQIRPDDVRELNAEKQKIKIAIVGAGRVGVSLAEELFSNPRAAYRPVAFIDINREKIGRTLFDLPVLSEEDSKAEALLALGVQEVVFALPQLTTEEKKKLYDFYKESGCKVKVYDFPTMQSAGQSKRALREFDVEELLFRKPVEFTDEKTDAYYRDKVILITGGGGSIGSELCRQIAKKSPKKLIILDVYENGAYDIQQELRIAYKNELDLVVEIVSVCDRKGLEKVFATYHPDIVLNAAAHKHVPLMEHNCVEAVKNNVFGTLNTVELSEQYGVEHFIMVSTDKAVNPTNVMGATKRMCEMIVESHSKSGSGTVFTATRFGNVLGSAGSVIPLFRRQIANGGPLTITDKRIIRYFMTIPEASQLVLQSGAMAKNGELFVLDMGKPVRILELAENMIRLYGLEPYRDIDIIETGLRPGEKLYEELLIKNEDLDKTDNSLIFIERDAPLSAEAIEAKLTVLRAAVATEDDDAVRAALHEVVPTFRTPEEVNAEATKAEEMKTVFENENGSADEKPTDGEENAEAPAIVCV